MRIIKKVFFSLFLIAINFGLIASFSLSFYLLYFLCLFFSLYLVHRYQKYFSNKIFLILCFFTFIIVNLIFIEEFYFEILLYMNLYEEKIHINSEVMYLLNTLHLSLLINLKKFDKFWVIIDKKLSKWD